MRIRFLTFIVFILLVCGNIFRLQAQENYEVRRITFQGNKTLDKDFLLEKMALKEVSYLEKVFTDKEPFLYSEELINLDLERLIRIYQSEGFLNARAALQPLKTNEKKQTLKLVIEVDEGQPVVTDSVSISFQNNAEKMDSLLEKEKVFKKLQLIKDERFRDEAINDDLRLIEDAFRSQGYAYATATYKLNLKLDENSTAIHYSVNPGPISHIGETTISGNKNVSEEFIKKQLKYSNGDLYSKSVLNETRQNLYRLRMFRVVSVTPEKVSETQKSPIPVSVYIEEAPRLNTRFGAGYGTEDKFRAFLDLSYRGFLGSARRLNLYLKRSAIEPYSARLSWIQPQFLGMNSSISVNPFINRKEEPGYTTRTWGVNVPFTYNFNPRLNSKFTYYFEDVEQLLEPGDEEFTDFESNRFPYKKSGVLFSTVFDNTSPIFSPSSGINVSLGFKVNGYLFGSDFNYTKLWGDFRTYQKTGEVVLAFRVMAGGINSSDSRQFIPVEDRFYSGGSNSIRGWNRSELGPKRESGTPLGGKSIFESNFEIRYPLFWRLSLVAFLEAGNVWEESYNYNFNDLGYAAGSGIRIDTPIGPVRFDAGFPLWNEKTKPQFFISVGQAF
jgi:outer membrane protein insertion porin family